MEDDRAYTVEVPGWLYPDTLAFIAERMTARAGAPAPTLSLSPTGVEVPGNGTWTEADLRDLSERLRNPLGRAVLTAVAMASLEGREATYEDLRAAGEAKSTREFSYDRLRSQLSWISKYCKAIKGTKVWCMKVTDHGPETPKGERLTYSMPTEIAEWWLATNEGDR
jgi:hypothetical protein